MQGYNCVIVIARDTDVLVLLLFFCTQLSMELSMQSGTYTSPRYDAIHNIYLQEEMLAALLAFHAVTSCDTTRD